MSSLLPHQQPLTLKQAAHLLRRATFGATPAQVKSYAGLTPQAAVERLMADLPAPAPPIDAATGQTFVDQPYNRDRQGAWTQYTKSWWLNLMLTGPLSLREKLALFWQNLFVSTLTVVGDPRFVYRQNVMIRRNALGNYRTFVIEVTKDPAMLRYLNGNQNVVGKPNENYARELQELFTIGRNNYTEDDIKAAARVLTGWTDTGYRNETNASIGTAFRANQHDTTDKKFSAAYQNTVIKGRSGATAGDEELAELVDMILRQAETARTICRKLYRWYVNADISADVEQNVIEPLAQVFRQGKYEIRPVVQALLTSAHFYDEAVRGAIIKSPLELIGGLWRSFSMPIPDPQKETASFYQLTSTLWQQSRSQQQDILDQPTVFGYKPYYDTGYYQIWINSNTLAQRGGFTDQFLNGIRVNGVRQIPDLITLARQTSNPSDAVSLVDELTAVLFAFDLTRSQKDYVIDQVLVPGLPRYVWSDEWNNYNNDPTNTAKQMAVQAKLSAMWQYLFRLAEYQMN